MERAELYNQLYQQIRERILSGRLQIGQLVSERSLAAEFHSSRTPIRRALQELLKEGLLVKRSQRGYIVNIATLDDLREVHDIRISLESLACYQAAQQMDETEFQALANLNYEARQIIEHSGDPKLLYKLQEKFLAQINAYSGMTRLQQLQEIVDGYLQHFDNVFLSNILPECSLIVKDNEALVEAMRKQDKAAIERIVKHRYSISYDYICNKLKAHSDLQATKD